MGFGSIVKRVAGYGIKPKTIRKVRRKLGLTARAKWLRGIKRHLGGTTLSSAPTSASTYDSSGYRYSGRTLSQMMGGA